MAGKTLIGGTAYKIIAGKTMINGVAHKVTGGKTMIGGTVYNINFGSKVVAVTITGSGSSNGCYATINGTKRYSAGTHEVNAGDTITFGVYGNRRYSGTVTIDGTEVLRVTDESTQTYDWTVPIGISTIEIAMALQTTSTGSTGRINVTTA